MKKTTIIRLFFAISVQPLFFLLSCGEDDDGPAASVPDARFVAIPDEADPFTFNFQNESENATSYSWDFGDGGSSSEENPSHTYSAEGTFTVTLVATSEGGQDTRTREVEVIDIFKELRKLTGTTSKSWKVVREGEAFRVGPIDDESTTWWAFGTNEPFANRPCVLTDEYIFSFDGTFEYKTNGEFFADGEWDDDVQFQCQSEDAAGVWINDAGEDISAWGSGVHSFELNVSANTLDLTGDGVFIGLQKVADTEEVLSPQASNSYHILKLEDVENGVDTLRLRVTHPGERIWDFTLVHYDNPGDEPPLPIEPPTAGFESTSTGLSVAFANSSTTADEYAWDFGDGTTSTEASPTHAYSEGGIYDVVLKAINSGGESESKMRLVVGGSTPTANDLHGDGAKTWTLRPGSGALAVAPDRAGITWWTNDQAWADNASCMFADQFTLNSDGSFVYNANGEVWTEGRMEGIEADGCLSEDALPAEVAEWASGNYTFSFTDAAGDEDALVTVTGHGAFLGHYKGANGSEPTAPFDGSITYEIAGYVEGANSDMLMVTVDYSAAEDGSQWWTFVLISQ